MSERVSNHSIVNMLADFLVRSPLFFSVILKPQRANVSILNVQTLEQGSHENSRLIHDGTVFVPTGGTALVTTNEDDYLVADFKRGENSNAKVIMGGQLIRGKKSWNMLGGEAVNIKSNESGQIGEFEVEHTNTYIKR